MSYDLHTHSTHSDGTTSPQQIAQQAAQLGLEGFALTDHDTTQGWEEARSEALQTGISFLPGIELTTTYNHQSLHLLAYGPQADHPRLVESLTALRQSRHSRVKKMIHRLRQDFVYDWDRLIAHSQQLGDVSIGRPHLADALVEAGYVQTRSEAFAKILSPASPYYLPTITPSTPDAIALVAEAGGVSVLAHPAAFRMRAPVSPSMLRELSNMGLSGVEIHHPENRAEWIAPLHRVANEIGLIITGSSDYHGVGKPNLLGECTTPTDVVEIIRGRVSTPH